ncbi:MAG: hypothetical protein MI923_07255 [Phycisphaerales bacterium]|nr:hypothetical protein [Phycisphaerales bacterium]
MNSPLRKNEPSTTSPVRIGLCAYGLYIACHGTLRRRDYGSRRVTCLSRDDSDTISMF